MPARLLTVVRRLLSFAAGSSVGLVIDLGGFFLLVSAGVTPWVANCISSSSAVTAVYLLVTRYAFSAVRRVRTYVAFVAWYAFVIAVSSTSIQLLTAATGIDPFLLKLASIPITFAANFCFSLVLFRDTRATLSAGVPRPPVRLARRPRPSGRRK